MAIGLQNFPNITPADSDYLAGRIKDNPGDGSGTPVNLLTNGDIQEFFAKLMNMASIVPNAIPDNEYSGHQYIEALIDLIANQIPAISDSGWIAIAAQNDWTATSAEYRKVANVVYLRGKLDSDSFTTNKIMGLLPAGFRPTTKIWPIGFADGIFTSGGVHAANPISIDTNGNVSEESFSYVVGDVVSIYLDGISFLVD